MPLGRLGWLLSARTGPSAIARHVAGTSGNAATGSVSRWTARDDRLACEETGGGNLRYAAWGSGAHRAVGSQV